MGDGYAVALSQQPAAGWSLTVSCGTSSITLTSASTRHTAYYNGEAYYLFPVTFPAAVTAPSGTHAAFRQEVTVGSRTYYFNPYFAKSVTTGTGTPDTIYLRTARHLYALSLYYTNYAAGTGSSTYLQSGTSTMPPMTGPATRPTPVSGSRRPSTVPTASRPSTTATATPSPACPSCPTAAAASVCSPP